MSLTDDINKLVEERLKQALETGEIINVPTLAKEMVESLADLIVHGALEAAERERLTAYAIGELTRRVAEKITAQQLQ